MRGARNGVMVQILAEEQRDIVMDTLNLAEADSVRNSKVMKDAWM